MIFFILIYLILIFFTVIMKENYIIIISIALNVAEKSRSASSVNQR